MRFSIRKNSIRFIIPALAITLAAANCFSSIARCCDDWTQFLGSKGDGHASNCTPPMTWTDSFNVEWKMPIPGLGWSSPVIQDDTLVLTTAVPVDSGLSLRVLAMDTHSGSMVWSKEIRKLTDTPSIHSKNSHASPTPIIDGDAVYVHFGTWGTAKLDTKSGDILWNSTELVYPPMHGSGGSPVLCDGRLVIICDGSKDPFVVALDAATGHVLWKTQRSVHAKISHSFGTPIVIKVDGVEQVIAPGPNHLAAYSLKDGRELWNVKADGWSVVPKPIVVDNLLIYNHDYDNPELIAVRLSGEGEINNERIAWRTERGAPSTPTPIVVGEEIYFVSDKGVASCLDAKTGQRHWMERLGGNYSASPLFVNNHILFLSEDGLATWIQPGTVFQKANTNQITGRTFATPAFARNAMFLRTDEYLFKIATR